MFKFSIKNAFRKKSTAILASIGVGVGLMLFFVRDGKKGKVGSFLRVIRTILKNPVKL